MTPVKVGESQQSEVQLAIAVLAANTYPVGAEEGKVHVVAAQDKSH